MIFDRIIGYASVESTMDIAREKALRGDAAGTVIMADFQTKGRGRQGRGWFAPTGANVCLTAVGGPIAAAATWRIALLAGVAAAEAVHTVTGIAARVRFPNDVYVDGAKLGGILVETVPHPTPGFVTPLIGIGVNINVPEDVFPEELRGRATSTLCLTGREYGVGAVSGFILRRLGELWDAAGPAAFEATVLTRWRALADPRSRRTFCLEGVDTLCRVIDVAGEGTVTLEAGDGARRQVHAAQVILGDD